MLCPTRLGNGFFFAGSRKGKNNHQLIFVNSWSNIFPGSAPDPRESEKEAKIKKQEQKYPIMSKLLDEGVGNFKRMKLRINK